MKTNLQALRKRTGYKSAKAFAEHIGLSKDTYTGYEQGRIAMTLARAWEFADALNCSLDELAGRNWQAEDESACEDARQKQLNDCYKLLSADSQEDLLGVASSFAADESRLASQSGRDTGDDDAEPRS